MPVVNGKEFPYTKKGVAAAKRAEDTKPSGMGMMNKTPGTMTNPQKTKKQSGMNDAAMKSQASSAKMEAMKSALTRAASAAKKTPAGSVAAELTYKLPARIGDTGTQSTMPATKGAPLKKKNLAG
jgi:hypothetical protein